MGIDSKLNDFQVHQAIQRTPRRGGVVTLWGGGGGRAEKFTRKIVLGSEDAGQGVLPLHPLVDSSSDYPQRN
jgi:hypothetical protein